MSSHVGGPGTMQVSGLLHVYTLGFWRQRAIRRILGHAGLTLATGWPGRGEAVGVWGRRPVSWRGRRIAAASGARLVTVEDGFLRSVRPGDANPLSLVIDDVGIYYDASVPSRLEEMLNAGVPDAETRARAVRGIETLRSLRLSKYNLPEKAHDLGQGYVLVIDQTAGDASIRGGRADAGSFRRMVEAARVEHPGRPLVIKQHPEVAMGRKRGHIGHRDLGPDDRLISAPVNPWDLIGGAHAVYTVTSQLGYEAVLAGKSVRCFGVPFYAGWGLTGDEQAAPRRHVRHDRASLFAACHLAYPIYYDPWRDRLTDFETAAGILATLRDADVPEAGARGEVFSGVRLWKRSALARFRPRYPAKVRHVERAPEAVRVAAREGRSAWHWASKASPDVAGGRVEDGFLRSVGLGAQLVEPLSLIFDRTGIYYDPTRPNDLDALIARAAAGGADRARAEALRRAIVAARVTKYNLAARASLPAPGFILVPGQVEDDASIRRGTGAVRTNLALLTRARQAHPEAVIVYKPHPDVEAGLRPGAVPARAAMDLADHIADRAAAIDLIERAAGVWTMTSLLGFEALLRGKPVTCVGSPFYAGWGLTQDLGPATPHRTARPTLDDLVWAALIAYPRYVDPGSGLPTTPERIVEVLAEGVPGKGLTMLARLQNRFSDLATLWR